MIVTTKTILDHVIEVHVDGDGQFYTMERGTHNRIATGDTMKQALRATRAEYKKEQIRVAVPFTYMAGDGSMHDAISRGFHARDRYTILIWWDDGTKEGKNDSLQGWYRHKQVLVPSIPERDLRLIQKLLARRTKLRELTTQCDGLIEKWETEHTFDLRAATAEALAVAAEAEPDVEEEPESPVSTSEDKEVDELLGEA